MSSHTSAARRSQFVSPRTVGRTDNSVITLLLSAGAAHSIGNQGTQPVVEKERPLAESRRAHGGFAAVQNQPVSQEMEDSTVKYGARHNVQDPLARLTRRERQVLNLLVAGKLSKQVAMDLSISPRTVELHRSRIMDKMKASNLANLICMLICPECANQFAIAANDRTAN